MEAFLVALSSVWADSGFSALTGGHVIMIVVGLVLLYMAIGKGFEPLLLSPIAFGCILANIPKNGFEEPGVMSVIMYGIHHEVFPPLIFLGVGAMTDFGPLLANPKTLLLGAAAQGGVFVALLGAMLLGFTVQEAAAIGIIGVLTARLPSTWLLNGSSAVRCNRSCCILLHVSGSADSASYHETVHH